MRMICRKVGSFAWGSIRSAGNALEILVNAEARDYHMEVGHSHNIPCNMTLPS